MKNALLLIAVAAIVSLMVAPMRAADISVGLITAMTGPGASIGIPYAKGAAAGVAYKDGVDGTKLNLIGSMMQPIPLMPRAMPAS